jgi:uridine kinase
LHEYLQRRFSGEVVVIHHNDYKKNGGGRRSKETHREIDWSALAKDVKALKEGKSVTKRKYNPLINETSGQETVQGKVIVVWGVFALHEPLLELANVKVYFESDKFTRMCRYFLSEISRMSPDDIVRSLLSGQKTNKGLVEPTRKDADYVLVNNEQPSFSGKRSRKLVDHLRWPVRLNLEKISVLGKAKMGPTRHQEEQYIFSTCRTQIVRLRQSSIAFLDRESDVNSEIWREFPLSQESSKQLSELYRHESMTVTRARTIYELAGSKFRIYVDTHVRIGREGLLKEAGEFSGLIRRHHGRGAQPDFNEIITRLGLKGQHPVVPYYQM